LGLGVGRTGYYIGRLGGRGGAKGLEKKRYNLRKVGKHPSVGQNTDRWGGGDEEGKERTHYVRRLSSKEKEGSLGTILETGEGRG